MLLIRSRQEGTSLIEVLVSVVIVVLGLLGLAGLQSHAALAEAEAFQRSQAITMLQDMTNRINSNRFRRNEYLTSTPRGVGYPEENCTTIATGGLRDLCEWNSLLLGTAELAGSRQVGGMPEARGCVTQTDVNMPQEYEIAVVWLGATPTKAPDTTCGVGLYGDDRYRRAITTRFRVGCLQNNNASGACTYPPAL